MSAFTDLTDELSELLKAQPLAKSQAMDDDPGGEGTDEGTDEDTDEDTDDPGDDEEALGKSLTVTLADGQTVDAVDGTALVKSLHTAVSEQRTENAAVFAEIADAMRVSTAMLKSIQQDNQALREQVERLSNTGRGRRGTLVVHEHPGLSGGGDPGATTQSDVMAKAMDAHKAGRITSTDVAQIDVYLGSGKPVPAALLARISG